MKIGLIDVDGHNYPNLPLMKISAYHKSAGDEVEWYDFCERYDRVYLSKVFSFTPDYPHPINAKEIIKGGTGYAIKKMDGKEVYDNSVDTPLPEEIEHIYPDYSIYNITDTAYGFLTRGCPRGCSFCHVAPKEGRCSVKVADLSEFWRGQRKIVLNDPNILACRDRSDLLDQLIDSKSLVDINQGVDIRMVNGEMCDKISHIKTKELHFAWDRYQDKKLVLPKFEMFAEKCPKKMSGHCAIVYCLVNYDTTIEQDLERIYTLRNLGYYPYVMVYDKASAPPLYKKLQRWVNNRFIFASCDRFEDYNNQTYPERKDDGQLRLF